MLTELHASPADLYFVASAAAGELGATQELAAARTELEFLVGLDGLDARSRDSARVEIALIDVKRNEFASAKTLLQTSSGLIEAPAVAAVLAATDTAPLDPASEAFVAALYAARWYGVRGELDLYLGRPDRAEGSFDRQTELARRLGDAPATWDALDHRLLLEMTLNDYAAVERLIRRAREDGTFAALDEHQQRKLAIRGALARYELDRRRDPRDARAAETFRQVLETPQAELQDRLFAAMRLALIGAETGRNDLAELGLSSARALSHEAGNLRAPEQLILAALEARVAAASDDRERLRAALAALEDAFPEFLAAWERVAQNTSGLGYLHFGDRYVVPSELVAACLALDGIETGSRRALAWLYRMQRIGGLARDLDLAAQTADLDGDLRELVGAESGVLLYQPGRLASHLFLIDADGVEVVEVGPSWRLTDDCRELTNAIASAVRRDAPADDPDVAAALRNLTRDALDTRALARLRRWKAATLIGGESFGHLPLELIELEDGHRVGDVLALGHAPSLPVAAALARRARERGRAPAGEFDLHLVGAPAAPTSRGAGPESETLDLPRERFELWQRRLDGRVALHLGELATPEALARVAAGCEAQQIVAHGQHDSSRECAAGFTLHGPDLQSARVWSEQIERTRAPRVTLLAVCGASQKPITRGDDGRAGLGASFVLAGSDCVVLTPADLEARSAIELFELASVRLARGDTPAQALMNARHELAEGSARNVLQNYLVHAWGAAHAAVVEPTPDDEPSEERGGLPAGLAVVLALAFVAALWVHRRRASA